MGPVTQSRKVSAVEGATQIVDVENQLQAEAVLVDAQIKEITKARDSELNPSTDVATTPSNKSGWTGKMGSWFRIFKGVEPQYIVKPLESSTAPSSPILNRFHSVSQSDLDSWLEYAENTPGEPQSTDPKDNSGLRKEKSEPNLNQYSTSAPVQVISLDSSAACKDNDDNDNDNDDDYESAESTQSDSEYTDPLNDMELELETPQLTIQAQQQDKVTITNKQEPVKQELSTTTNATQLDLNIKQNTNAVLTPIDAQEHTTMVITKEQQNCTVETTQAPALTEGESLPPRPLAEDIGFLGSLTTEQLIGANIQLSKCGQLIQSTSGANAVMQ